MTFTLCPLFFSSGSILSRIRNFPDASTNCSSICKKRKYCLCYFNRSTSKNYVKVCARYLKVSSCGVQRILYEVRMVATSLQQHQDVLQFQVDLSIHRHKHIHHWSRAKQKVTIMSRSLMLR